MQKKMKNQIFETLRVLDQDKITDKHFRWEYLKYKIRIFTMNFSKNLVKEENKDRNFFGKRTKKLEKNLTNFQTNNTLLNVNKNFKIYIPQK